MSVHDLLRVQHLYNHTLSSHHYNSFISLMVLYNCRDDVAEVCIQSLLHDGARQKSIDLIAKEPGQEGSTVTKDWRSFFGRVTGSCVYEQ